MVLFKKITALLFMLLMIMTVPGMAAAPSAKTDSTDKVELSVKEQRTRSGIVNVAVPHISGAVGGKAIDDKVNQAVFDYVNSVMKQILTAEEVAAFETDHKEISATNDVARYNAELVKYTNKIIADKNTTERVTASWYVRNEYEVKAARKSFYSVVLKTKTYTGGAGDVITWKAMNFDMKDGSLLELKDLFEADADYATRLQTLIGYQQLGRARLLRHIKGRNVGDPEPVTITGQEEFYVDGHYNLGIILYSNRVNKPSAPAKTAEEVTQTAPEGEKATGEELQTKPEGNETDQNNSNSASNTQKTGPVTIEVYDISLNDFADLIKL